MSVAPRRLPLAVADPHVVLPDYLLPGLCLVFVGFNPGRRSALVAHHYAGRTNQFWRLIHDAGITPRLVCFNGKTAFEGVAPRGQASRSREKVALGFQPQPYANCRVFVAPSSSAANQNLSYAEKLDYYRALARLLAKDEA